jgi:hypothetical protein
MAVKLWSNKIEQFNDTAGVPRAGAKLFTYVGGSVNTKQTTYTTSVGDVPNANPIILNADGKIPQPIWLTTGVSYKFVLAPPTDTDPPTSPIDTIDVITGINDSSTVVNEWVSAPAPTFVSTTQFTLAGDQTSNFHVGRRVKCTVTAGTVYGTITVSAFTTLTTVTIELDSGTLDSGLSAVSYGLISQNNDSDPAFTDQAPVVVNKTDRTKRVRVSASGLTTAKTRVLTVPDQDFTIGALPRSYLAGLTMSTAGASTTMSVAAGQASDSTNAVMMTIASSIAKTTAAWAVGTAAGGLDTGAIANSTWYHFYEIMRPDTGVVDVAFSLNAVGTLGANVPAAYTRVRRIGSGLTNGSAQWVAFTQDGDYFRWSASVLDVNTTNPGTAAVTSALTVPTGVNVQALVNAYVTTGASTTVGFILSDLAANDEAPSETAAPLMTAFQQAAGTGPFAIGVNAQIRTNTSAQIRSRQKFSDASTIARIATLGWVDSRGRNS